MSSVAADDDLARLEGRVIGERYTLEHLISSGTYGAVFRATDKQFPASPVAIKLARSPLMEKSGSLFEREAKLLRMLDHPNVVRVYDYGFWQDHAFIVMAFLEGETLNQLLKRHQNALPTKLLLQFIREIGTALAYAHANNAVHRDLKPDNVFLVTSRDSLNQDGQLLQRFVLLDFGIATKFDDGGSLANKTVAGLGTPEYRSPEQIHSSRETPLDENPSTDIYTFGVLLYRLLTGRLPFRMENGTVLEFARVTQEIVKQPPPRLTEIAPDRHIKPQIEALVLECLEKDTAKRPRSIGEVRDRFLKSYERPAVPPAPKRAGTLAPESEGNVFLESIARRDREQFGTEPTTRKSGYIPWLYWTFMAIAALAVMAAVLLRRQSNGLPPTPSITAPKLLTDHLVLSAIKPAELWVEVPATWDADKVKVALLDVEPSRPQENKLVWLNPKPNVGGKQLSVVVYTVEVDPNLPPGDHRFDASISNGEEPATNIEFSVSVESPAWLPPDTPTSRFRGSGKLVVCGDRILYRRLICEDPTAKTPEGIDLVFCLVDANEKDRKPFYIMRDEVWIGLYRRWVRDSGGRAKIDSQIEANDDSMPMRWIVPQEAIDFSKWLLGDFGDLPMREEWWTAADYSPKKSRQNGPFKGDGKSGIAINMREPVPVGKSPNDVVEKTGCRNLAGNVSEWTKLNHPQGAFHVEGSSFADEVLDDSLYAERDELPAPAEKVARKDVGFRVVMHVP